MMTITEIETAALLFGYEPSEYVARNMLTRYNYINKGYYKEGVGSIKVHQERWSNGSRSDTAYVHCIHINGAGSGNALTLEHLLNWLAKGKSNDTV